MGVRGGYAGALLLGLVLTTGPAGASGTPGLSTAVSPAAPPAIVKPFFIRPNVSSATSPKLPSFNVIPVLRGDQVTVACWACGRTVFQIRRYYHRVIVTASPTLQMGPATQIVVGVIAAGQPGTPGGEIGRWIAFGFPQHRYGGIVSGCMPASVTALTSAEAFKPKQDIPYSACGRPSTPGTEYVYWTGPDHEVYEKPYGFNAETNKVGWDDTDPIGSGTAVLSEPSALICRDGERDVFWQGFDRRLHWMTYDGDWNGESTLPAAKIGSAPTALVDSAGAAHVFWEGTDGYVYEMIGFRGVLHTHRLNSGAVGSPPAAVARRDGTVDLFWLGTNKQLWEMPHARQGAVAKPVTSAGLIASAPAAALEPDGTEDVFWRGTDGVLWELSRSAKGDQVNSYITGTLGSAPAAVVHPTGVVDVFWRGTFDGLREFVDVAGEWGPAQPVPYEVPVGSRPAGVLAPDHETARTARAGCG